MAGSTVFLVEGKDDEHVLRHLCQHYQIEQPQVKDKKGISNLLETLEVEIDASQLERLGIIVDADTEIKNRWIQIKGILKNSGYNSLPDLPDENGTIIKESGHPIVGVWLMPENSLPGMLEDFVSFLIPQADNLWGRAQKAVNDIPDTERQFPTQHAIKAKIHTWLAWQEEPGKPLGLAITARYLDAEAAHAKKFVAWVNRLLTV